MFIHHRAARGGRYRFMSAIDQQGGITVWLVSWSGRPLQWATSGHVDRFVRRDLEALKIEPIGLLIDFLTA